MTKTERDAIQDLARVAEAYAKIYESRYRKAAAQSFLDGATFLTMMKDDMIEPDQITEELCRKVREVSDRFVKEARV
jgi:hypothetical protein